MKVKLPSRLAARRRRKEPEALRRLRSLDGGQATKAGAQAKEPAAAADHRPAHPNRRRRIVLAIWTTAVIVVAGLLLLLVLPTRAWLSQRSAIASAERRLAVLQAENAKLSARVAALQTPDEVERVAREQYNLAHPGEKVLSVLPAPALTNLPSGWPFSLVNEIVTARSAPASTPPTSG
jgi:cell division protein FtsB